MEGLIQEKLPRSKVGDMVYIKSLQALREEFGVMCYGDDEEIQHPIGFSADMKRYCEHQVKITKIETGFDEYPESYFIDDCNEWWWTADMFDNRDVTNKVHNVLRGLI